MSSPPSHRGRGANGNSRRWEGSHQYSSSPQGGGDSSPQGRDDRGPHSRGGRSSGPNHRGFAGNRGRFGGGRGGGGGAWGNRPPPRPPTCFRCGEVGHKADECTSDSTFDQRTYTAPSMPRHTVPFIDTHCHVDYMCEQARVPNWGEFKEKIPLPPTYGGCITTFCDSTAICSTFSQHEDLFQNHPDVYFTWGLHPHNAKYWSERVESRIFEMVTHERCVGFGEIGLDVTSDKKGGSDEADQITVFTRQLEMAQTIGKPIIIHYRGPGSVIIDLLSGLPATQKLHLHCWGDPTLSVADRLMKQFPNLYFGFTGLVVNNGKMAPLLAHLPLERIVLESDGPYMLPAILRPPKGSHIMHPVNHPGNIPFTAETIGAIRNISTDAVLKKVSENVLKLYGITPLKGSGVGNSVVRQTPAAVSTPPEATATKGGTRAKNTTGTSNNGEEEGGGKKTVSGGGTTGGESSSTGETAPCQENWQAQFEAYN